MINNFSFKDVLFIHLVSFPNAQQDWKAKLNSWTWLQRAWHIPLPGGDGVDFVLPMGDTHDAVGLQSLQTASAQSASGCTRMRASYFSYCISRSGFNSVIQSQSLVLFFVFFCTEGSWQRETNVLIFNGLIFMFVYSCLDFLQPQGMNHLYGSFNIHSQEISNTYSHIWQHTFINSHANIDTKYIHTLHDWSSRFHCSWEL